jgi:hypothetical protein
LTQESAAGGDESPANPDAVDVQKHLHVYLAGEVPGGRKVQVHPRPRPSGACPSPIPEDVARADGVDVGARIFKVTISHFNLQPHSTYLLHATDSLDDPLATTSREIRTS